jgi:hypothetical protein
MEKDGTLAVTWRKTDQHRLHMEFAIQIIVSKVPKETLNSSFSYSGVHYAVRYGYSSKNPGSAAWRRSPN